MTAGFFEYPAKAAFGRVLPKTKVFAFGKVTRRLRDQFAAEVERITWQYKLAPETINLPVGPGVPEIQIFSLELKAGLSEPSESIFRCIDSSIAFPIFFEVAATHGKSQRLKVISAYKRPSEADSSKWVLGDYFSSAWLPADTARSPLPVALNLGSLYDQMLRQLLPLAGKPAEALADLIERNRLVTAKQRELQKLELQLRREKQFNRKVEINAQVRCVNAALLELTAAAKES